MNPYFHTEFNPDFPPGHPVNTFIERSSGFIPGDAWGTCHRHQHAVQSTRGGPLHR